MGPKVIIDKMKAILTHIGAWAPKAEQVATAKFLADLDVYAAFLEEQKSKIDARLQGLYAGLQSLKNEGFPVEVIAPQAAIYLTVQLNLVGKTTDDGTYLAQTADVTKYILDEAKLAVVPFYAFGTSTESSWYRFSVGTCGIADVPVVIANLRDALSRLK
jgi:aspartate aminotransferase